MRQWTFGSLDRRQLKVRLLWRTSWAGWWGDCWSRYGWDWHWHAGRGAYRCYCDAGWGWHCRVKLFAVSLVLWWSSYTGPVPCPCDRVVEPDADGEGSTSGPGPGPGLLC